MNIYGIETFLIGVMIPAFFIYLRKHAPKLRKVPLTPTFRQSEPTFHAKKSKTVNRHKSIGANLAIAGYFAVYPIV